MFCRTRHSTVYRIIQDSFRTFFYFSFCPRPPPPPLTRSIHVHNPPRLAPAKQARIEPHLPFLFPFACVRLKYFLHPFRFSQLCRWSRECPSRSAFAFSFVPSHLIQHHTSGSRRAISCHTHTHTHTLSLSLPCPFARSVLCAFAFPSGTRTRFGSDLSPNSLAVWTFHLQYNIEAHLQYYQKKCSDFKISESRHRTFRQFVCGPHATQLDP